MDRRSLLKFAGAGAVLWAVPLPGAAAPFPSFSAAQKATLASLLDTILPATDTPGAAEAGVPAFVELMVFDWFEPAQRDQFGDDFARFEKQTQARFGKRFEALSPGDRLKHLYALQDAEGAHAAHRAGFVMQLKRLAIYGYYTSEIGASDELELNLVPGEYEPCAALHAGERAPSLTLANPIFPFEGGKARMEGGRAR
jgi:hypothetical protein